jgi:PAS domain S-box-containing protein
MNGLGSIFIAPSSPASYLQGTYSPGLVVLSLFVSVFSATMALQTAHIARKSHRPKHKHVAVATGAVALGGGIWSMHFVGMLAFQLCTQVGYQVPLTLLSILPSLGASWLALHLLSRPHASHYQLLIGGVVVGLGIGAMHYSGMAAMRMSALLRYDPATFALSIVVAVALSTLALWLRFGLSQTLLGPLPRLLISGLVMGLAIAAMHYVGMAAARFIGTPDAAASGPQFDAVFASIALSAFTVTATVLVSAINGLIRIRELYRKMEEGKLRLHSILDTAVDGIITIDSRGRIQEFNHSAERLFGWSAAEVQGHNIQMLMPEPDTSRHDDYLRNYLASGLPKIIGAGREVMGLRKDGSLMPMRLAVGRVDLPKEQLFVGFVTDITDRHALEASLRETAERAERAAAAKSTFLANMSHEIRTPMNSIIGFTELLLQGELSPVQRNHLNTVRQSSRSLLGLLNDILDTTKMEKGRVLLESIDFSLKSLALQIEASLRLSAQSKQLSLSTRYPAQMPEHFRGDPLRVLQVLTNLVGNAIKFTEHGGVEITFAYEQGLVYVQVRDTGIGMTAQQVASIFAPFTQADASISRRFGGTGLGTTIARQLVELMDGRIEVESEPGHGSTFHVRLPLPVGRMPAVVQPEASIQTLPALHVLVADDVPQNLELVRLLLQQGGHQVTTALDGEEALRKYMAGRFDVVLMDVHMPGTDGLEATRRIRGYEQTQGRPPTPVIALTASVMAEDRRAAHKAGMNGFAVKPLDAAKLLTEIAQVLHVPAPASSIATSATNTPTNMIDWRAGASLWGSEQRLHKALERFLAEVDARHPLPDPAHIEIDWDTTQASLHGIHGAAGNLALPGVATLARELEALARSQQREQALLQIAQLRQMLTGATTELRDRQALPTTTSAAEPPASLPTAMRELQLRLARNELDDALLAAICAGLDQDNTFHSHALRAAVESFEFDHAQHLLQQLLDTRGP